MAATDAACSSPGPPVRGGCSRYPASSPTPWPPIWLPIPPGADGWLFTSSTGAPWGHARYGSELWGIARRRAALPEGTTTHDLRHHYASVLLAAGESVVAVADRLGHENATLVLTTYGHLMPDSEDRTRRAVDETWSTLGAISDGPSTALRALASP